MPHARFFFALHKVFALHGIYLLIAVGKAGKWDDGGGPQSTPPSGIGATGAFLRAAQSLPVVQVFTLVVAAQNG